MTLAPNHGAIEPFTTIVRRRTLSRPGQLLVNLGAHVSAQDVVARARVAQGHRIVNIAKELSVPLGTVNRYIVKQVGETVEQNEPLAARRSIAGLKRTMVRSPIDGEVVEASNGMIVLEGEPQIIEVRASLPGTVIDTSHPLSVTIEGRGALIRAAWGHGGLEISDLKLFSTGQDEEGYTRRLDEIEHRAIVVAIPEPLTEEILHAAQSVHVGGLIAASMSAQLVPQVKQIGFPVILTEGFGQLPMAAQTTALLQENVGQEISLVTGSSEHWRGTRPEIIIPRQNAEEQLMQDDPQRSLETGKRVRVLRGTHTSQIGTITALPARPRALPSGLWLKGAIVRLNNTTQEAFVPFANFELLG